MTTVLGFGVIGAFILVALQHKVISILRKDKELLTAEIFTVMENETDVNRRVQMHHVLQATKP